MTTERIKCLVGAVLLGATMTTATDAQAYWGGPRGGPVSGPGWGDRPGFGPMFRQGGMEQALERTHERQSAMLDHRAAMQALGRMLSGRRNFDRADAIAITRQIEASAGANLARLFKPGDWRRSPISRARIGEDMGIFDAQADALQQAAGELADALEKQPGREDLWAGRAWSPNWVRGGPWRSHRVNDQLLLTKPVFDAYIKLQSSCDGCHANFRTPWR